MALRCPWVWPILLLLPALARSKDQGSSRYPVKIANTEELRQFLEDSELAVIGFFKDANATGTDVFMKVASELPDLPFALCSESDVWERYNINVSTVSIFRKVDDKHEALELHDGRTVDAEGLLRFIKINELYYLTEYNAVTAIGIFKSEVVNHLLLLADKKSPDFAHLKKRFRDTAPDYQGRVLFILVDATLTSNAQVLSYFGLQSKDLPAVGLYNTIKDKKWLMPAGEINRERVQEFCNKVLAELDEASEKDETESKTEL
ncbi:endoplasmic reticulum resident protein 27 [Erpetoichthys calabaricus]|uniref:Endoplasmic reticulum protein 27 n=1 Tax=Erpetoichthys calabaricus TaxID=27687 RepID=A0A8C4SAP3_ERPCA|nr:endoplasmic reticulum resident protein 27 [Erpetoichthys calabaricus]